MIRTSVILLTGASLAAAGGQLLFKVGAADKATLSEYLNASILLGLILYGLGTAVWIYVLSKEKLVAVYSFTVLTFALVYLGGVLLLGESLEARAICGIALVMGGLYLVAT